MTDDSPLRICGWMQFKHEHTAERVTAPAIASFVSRPIGWGEKERMALALRSPVTDIAGFWEEVRHDMWAQGAVDEGKLWTPMGFKPNDPSVAAAIGSRIADVLAHTPGEARKNKPPERRLGSCRFDEWFKGYCVDLVWDPLRDLEPTARTLAAMAAEGIIHGDGPEMTEHWLGQPLSRLAERRPYSNSLAKAAETRHDSRRPSTMAISAKDSATTETQPRPPVPAAAAAPVPAAAPAPVPAAAAAPVPAASAVPAADPLDSDDNDNDNDREARSIFGGSDLPSFSDIAKASGDEHRWRSEAQSPPATQADRAVQERATQAQPDKALSIHFGRYPAHRDDGSIDWSTALLVVDGFMEREAFDAVKRHRRATRAGHAPGRQESLYAIGALQDLARADILFELDGVRPLPKMIALGERGERMLDAPNYALFALSKSADPVGANIPALARAKFYRDKLSALLSNAPRSAATELPSMEWIQLSPGAARSDAAMVAPAEGMVKWTRGEAPPVVATLLAEADREKLRRLCSNLSAASSFCLPADPAPEGPVPAGAQPPQPIDFSARPRAATQGAR